MSKKIKITNNPTRPTFFFDEVEGFCEEVKKQKEKRTAMKIVFVAMGVLILIGIFANCG